MNQKIGKSLALVGGLWLCTLSMPAQTMTPNAISPSTPFTFVAWGDSRGSTSGAVNTMVLSTLSNQAQGLIPAPAFTIFAGDLCDGFDTSCTSTGTDGWEYALNGGSANNGTSRITFPFRGNHDDNAALWDSYFAGRDAAVAAIGGTNFNSYPADGPERTYSFDYANSHIVGIDMPRGDIASITSGQIDWLDSDITAAESRGVTHTFILDHGPIYYVDDHSSTPPARLINVMNKHASISATFHGHEHVMAYVHADSSHISGVTHPWEEFVTGGAGAPLYNCKTSRLTGATDYCEDQSNGFVSVEVSGDTFTVSLYLEGQPAAAKTWTFAKSPMPPPPDTIAPTVTAFITPTTSSTLTVPITSLTATDNVGVTGYMVKESATTPTAGAVGWTTTPTTSFTFATAGQKTLYAWAKDAAGNVSTSLSATTTISEPTGGSPESALKISLRAGGAGVASTIGSGGPVQTGYAAATVTAGGAPYGVAVFSFRNKGVVVSEAAVPASPPTTSARIGVDYRSGVPAMPGLNDAGLVDISTGLAIANPGSTTANVTYTLRDRAGTTLTTGHGGVASGAHFAKFIHQLKEVAPDFNITGDFPTATQFGSLDIASDQPLSVLALHLTVNQRNEALLTSTPIADLTQPPGGLPLYFPQFVVGGGYLSTLTLLNTSSAVETGRLALFGDGGAALVVNQVGGKRDSTFAYTIQPGGVFVFETDGSRADANVGSVQLTPDANTSSPVGAGVFSFSQGGIRVTESGVPSATPTTHARIYIDQSGHHGTGLAIACPGNLGVSVILKAFQTDGSTPAGESAGVNLNGNGHTARFVSQLLSGLPTDFTGVLDISSLSPFVALTLRSLTNSRGHFLMTTFPIADATQPAPAPIVFPQIADGGGYTTEFIVLSAGGASSMTLNFYGEDGTPLAVGK